MMLRPTQKAMNTGRKSWLIGSAGLILAGTSIASLIVTHQHRTPGFLVPTVAQGSGRPSTEILVPLAQASPSAEPVATALSPVSIPPLPTNATSVPDDDLLRLSALVDLASAADRPPNKDGWRQAISIAEQLQQGPCDCEQRNWLHHFVETGNSALGGSSSDYAENAQLMLTLARNDKQAMALGHKTN